MNQPTVTEKTSTTPHATHDRVKAAVIAKGKATIAKKTHALKQLVVEYVPHGILKPNPYNPNRQSDHDFELLCQSMTEDGFTQPIIATRATAELLASPKFDATNYAIGDLVIVDGEHRWRAADVLGYAEVPIVVTSMTPEQMRVATLRHNRARGSEDIELAADVLRDLQLLGALDHAKDSLMLDDAEVNKLLMDVSAAQGMKAEEFGEAWQPALAADQPSVKASETKSDATGAVILTAMTPGAIRAQREMEEKLKKATSDKDKAAAREEAKIYRVHLVFAGEEADLVKQALSEEPAKTLVAMCRARLATIGTAPLSAAPEPPEPEAAPDIPLQAPAAS